jgi:hypothetical protein
LSEVGSLTPEAAFPYCTVKVSAGVTVCDVAPVADPDTLIVYTPLGVPGTLVEPPPLPDGLPPQADWNKHPAEMKTIAPSITSFPRFCRGSRTEAKTVAGSSNQIAYNIEERCAAIAVVDAVVEMVRVAVPPLLIEPKAQVGPLLAAGATAQVSATFVGSSPPDAVIVIVEVLDDPAVTDDGDGADAASVNAGLGSVLTTWLSAGETLAVKFVSPE